MVALLSEHLFLHFVFHLPLLLMLKLFELGHMSVTVLLMCFLALKCLKTKSWAELGPVQAVTLGYNPCLRKCKV